MSITAILSDFHQSNAKLVDPAKFKNLRSAVRSWMNAWPAQETETDYLRASQMYFTCPREFILNYWQPQPNRSFTAKSQLMMSAGTHLHYFIQNYMLGPMGILYGRWAQTTGTDIEERNIVRGFHPDPEKALYEVQHQKPLTWLYLESRVWNDTYRISGHIDGMVDISRIDWLHENSSELRKDPTVAIKKLQLLPRSDHNMMLLEIKTCGSWVFENLVDSSAIPEYYKMQAEIYQHLKDVPKTVFWYINRDSMDSKVLMYEYTKRWWEEARRKARIIWRSIQNETLPTMGMACITPTDKRAKECSFRSPCFDEMDFSEYVRMGKQQAEEQGRRFLDLSGLVFD